MAKKTLMLVGIGLVMLIVGVGGGIMVGLKYFGAPKVESQVAEVPLPGPMFPLGDSFTVNLADQEPHIVRVKVTLELSSTAIQEKMTDPGWLALAKNEVIRSLKSLRYDDVRYPEGMEKAQQDLRAQFNSMFPTANGEVAVKRVLFEEFMVQ